MKKSLLGTILLGSVLFAGCSCEHVWQEATCSTPKTCVECGETEGEVLEHTFSKASCTTPEICKACGATGEAALEHDFLVATCAQAETCSRCGEQRGERLPHEEQFIGECDLCHEIQNKDLVETIVSKLEEANDYMMTATNTLYKVLEDIESEMQIGAGLSLEGEDREERIKQLEALGYYTMKDYLVKFENLFVSSVEVNEDIYKEIESLYTEVCELCGDYKELEKLKEKLETSLEKIPEDLQLSAEGTYEQYDIPWSEGTEVTVQEMLQAVPLIQYALDFDTLSASVTAYWEEVADVAESVGIKVGENWWE